MAIEPVMADVIRKLAPGLPNRRALCLGYPDILATSVNPHVMTPDRQAIAKWHHWGGGIQSAEDFFEDELDLVPEYWDVTRARGPERIVDLNLATEKEHWYDDERSVGQNDDSGWWTGFALVIDPGTIEHIANIGNCWRTICAVTAVGGYVVHANPLNMPNHAFYAINPTAYCDVYEANGFEIVTMQELSGPLDNRTRRIAPHVSRFSAAPNAVMLCVARKRENVAFRFPVQSKYRLNPMLKAAQ